MCFNDVASNIRQGPGCRYTRSTLLLDMMLVWPPAHLQELTQTQLKCSCEFTQLTYCTAYLTQSRLPSSA